MQTLHEFIQDLKEHDELEILERLRITTEELLDRFDDRVEEIFESDDIEEDDFTL